MGDLDDKILGEELSEYYYYKGNFYKVTGERVHKHTETREWYTVVEYYQTGSNMKCSREKEDFYKKFKVIVV